MKVLTITNVFPSKKYPHRGTQVANQIKSLEPYIKVSVLYNIEKSWKGYLMFMLKTFYSILKGDYDLVHAHYGFYSAIIPALCRCEPLVVTYHGSDALVEHKRNKLYKALQRYVVSSATHLIAVSGQIRLTLIDELDANPDKISVIPMGVDTKQFRPRSQEDVRRSLGIDINKRIVLFIGRLTNAKGVDLIREASNKLRDVEFYLIGDGQIYWDAPNCNFVGVLDHTKIPDWINAADVLLLPSQSEGTPVVVLEALASEKPVICSRVGECPELIVNGVNGLLLPTRDTKSLVRAINSALYKITFNTNMGRTTIINRYRLEYIAGRIYQLYCTIFKEYKKRAHSKGSSYGAIKFIKEITRCFFNKNY